MDLTLQGCMDSNFFTKRGIIVGKSGESLLVNASIFDPNSWSDQTGPMFGFIKKCKMYQKDSKNNEMYSISLIFENKIWFIKLSEWPKIPLNFPHVFVTFRLS